MLHRRLHRVPGPAKIPPVPTGISIALAALAMTGCEPAVGVYDPPIAWRASVAVGRTNGGSLRRGVQLPPSGPHHLTYDPARRALSSPAWRRWGTDRLVRTTLCVCRSPLARAQEWPRLHAQSCRPRTETSRHHQRPAACPRGPLTRAPRSREPSRRPSSAPCRAARQVPGAACGCGRARSSR